METIDKFSWQRVWAFRLMYGKWIKRQVIWYMALTLAFYIICVLIQSSLSNKGAFMSFYTPLGFIIGMMVYFGSFVFLTTDRTLVAQTPVKPSEKLTFYVLYSVPFIALICNGFWYVLCFVGGCISSDWNLTKEAIHSVMIGSSAAPYIGEMFSTTTFWVISVLLSCFMTTGMMLSILHVVLCARKHPVVKAIGTMLAFTMGVGFISGIVGGAIGFYHGFNDIEMADNAIVPYIMKYTFLVMSVISVLSLLFGVYLTSKTYKRLKHPEVF